MPTDDNKAPDASPPDQALEGLSEADRKFVLEARRRLQARQRQPYVSETLERRVESELGVEPEDR